MPALKLKPLKLIQRANIRLRIDILVVIEIRDIALLIFVLHPHLRVLLTYRQGIRGCERVGPGAVGEVAVRGWEIGFRGAGDQLTSCCGWREFGGWIGSGRWAVGGSGDRLVR